MAEPLGGLVRQDAALPAAAGGAIGVVLVNAMSDAALATTERRFSRLLHSAFPFRTIRLRCVTLPEIPRGDMAAARIARFYATLDEVVAAPPDAVIFSGAEPLTERLTDEVFWPSLTALFDWVRAENLPALFSCLAAHAAVLHYSGVQRRRLPSKMFGMFAQSWAMPHPLLRGAPANFRIAHSRWNELAAPDLAAAGYTVLTKGPDCGVDMFVPQGGAPHIFLQGHPEYEDTALEQEYRRDLRRHASGESRYTPAPPKNLPAFVMPAFAVPQLGGGFAEAGQTPPPGSVFIDRVLKNWISAKQEMSV
jgi:homoserine O-succinyltransferase